MAHLSKPHGGLKRPTTIQSFQYSLPTLPDGIESQTITFLSKQVHLITLLFRRNKNQHRSQPFFKHLHLLRHALSRLLATHTKLANITSPESMASGKTADSVRRRFEAEASLRAHRDVYEESIRETIVPRCYVAFGAVVGDTQFANLGVVLMGVLADVVGSIGGPSVKEEKEQIDECVERVTGDETTAKHGQAATVEGTSTKVTGEDWGEVIERVYEATDSDAGLGELNGYTRAGDRSKEEDDNGKNEAAHVIDGEVEEILDSAKKHKVYHAGISEVAIRKVNKTATHVPEYRTVKEADDRPRKKKKKGKSAIDDLFKGLF